MAQGNDRRGAKPGSRKGTPDEGKSGNLPYERDDRVAKQIEVLTGFGMPQDEILIAIAATFGEDHEISADTLQRHYRSELDRGKVKAKQALLNRAHRMAMMEEVPDGVSGDKAYDIASKKVDFLLNVVHSVRPAQTHEFTGGAINVTIGPDDEDL